MRITHQAQNPFILKLGRQPPNSSLVVEAEEISQNDEPRYCVQALAGCVDAERLAQRPRRRRRNPTPVTVSKTDRGNVSSCELYLRTVGHGVPQRTHPCTTCTENGRVCFMVNKEVGRYARHLCKSVFRRHRADGQDIIQGELQMSLVSASEDGLQSQPREPRRHHAQARSVEETPRES